MAIAGGRVVAAGSVRDVDALAGAGNATSWRLPRDSCVMPGITDAHLHLATAALAAAELDLDGRAAIGRRWQSAIRRGATR